jgi:hypothetical protein
MDGVIADWSGGLCKAMKIDPLLPEVQDILQQDKFISGPPFGTLEEVDTFVKGLDYDFWYNLELLPWAKTLFELVRKYTDEVFFLSSPGEYHVAGHAKLDYIKKHFGWDKYILTAHKYLCARSDRILIDDLSTHIDKFSFYGGNAFYWPNQWELLNGTKTIEETLDLLTQTLDMMATNDNNNKSKQI